jgi:CubicO group peptidase (beta-lactamase class C family)
VNKLLPALILISAQFASASVGDWKVLTSDAVSNLQAAQLWVGGAVGMINGAANDLTSYGSRSLTDKTVPKPQSKYEIGSLSKTFVGVLLAELVTENPKLSLDEPISKYVPAFSDHFVGTVTLRQLATHTSGLPRLPCSDLEISYCFDTSKKNPYKDYSVEKLLAYLNSYQPSTSGPYSYAYSNLGFAVLSYVLTQIDHHDFSQMLKKRITNELGMGNTFVEKNDSDGILPGFNVVLQSVENWQWNSFAGAGGIVSTPKDFMKYLQANISPPPSQLGQAIKMSQQLGLGWDSSAGADVIYKSGSTGGFSSEIKFNPKSGTGVFVFGNISTDDLHDVAKVPYGYSLPDFVGKPFTPENYIGHYSSGVCTIEITQEGKFLKSVKSNGAQYRLDSHSVNEFDVDTGSGNNGDNQIIFDIDSGHASGLNIHYLNPSNAGSCAGVHYLRDQ